MPQGSRFVRARRPGVLPRRTGRPILIGGPAERRLDGPGRILRDYYAALKREPVPEPIAVLLTETEEKPS